MDDILTIRDVAARLKLGERTITAMLAEGELPGFKLRGQWRLRKSDFERWLAAVANGGKAEAVTAAILSASEEPAPSPPAPLAEATQDPASDSAEPEKVEPLTKKVSQVELHRRFITALGPKVQSHT